MNVSVSLLLHIQVRNLGQCVGHPTTELLDPCDPDTELLQCFTCSETSDEECEKSGSMEFCLFNKVRLQCFWNPRLH